MTNYELHQLLKIADNVEKGIFMPAGNGTIRLEYTLMFRDRQLELYSDNMEKKQFREVDFEKIAEVVDEWHMEEIL